MNRLSVAPVEVMLALMLAVPQQAWMGFLTHVASDLRPRTLSDEADGRRPSSKLRDYRLLDSTAACSRSSSEGRLREVRDDPAFHSCAAGHHLRAVIGGRTSRQGRLLAAGAVGAVGLGSYGLLVRGSLTLDLGIGRSVRPLGPLSWRIDAPRDLVFEIISAPYLGRTTRALQTKLRVLERGADLALAEHYTRVGPITTTTVETVRFEPPNSVQFRLVRGPVPLVLERFELREERGGTTLEYTGQLGTDLWGLGRWWGARVGARWEAVVQSSLDSVQAEAERASRTS